MDLGMPTLIELPEVEDCAALCAELGLQFVELNMNMPQFQTGSLEESRLWPKPIFIRCRKPSSWPENCISRC
ncbi:hypothetical protein IMSAGC003_01763 [Lachnospiraceae bacterium]|nr:hypothetical protein IMSAGC003_01763 [Lachnospiraceae bacterium]